MKAIAGNQIVIESEKAGAPVRKGRILEVLESEYGTRYRVLWSDGHESTIHPQGGTFRVTHDELEPLATLWR